MDGLEFEFIAISKVQTIRPIALSHLDQVMLELSAEIDSHNLLKQIPKPLGRDGPTIKKFER